MAGPIGKDLFFQRIVSTELVQVEIASSIHLLCSFLREEKKNVCICFLGRERMTRFRRLGGPHRVDHRKLLGMLESDIFVATQLLTTKKIHSFFFFFDWIYTIERIKLVRFLIGREPSPLHGKRIAIHFLPDRDKMGWMLFSSSLQSSALYSKVSNIFSVISDI